MIADYVLAVKYFPGGYFFFALSIGGLSNKLDSELIGRKPVKRPHGQVVGTAIVDGKLLCKIVQRIEAFRSSRWPRSTLPLWRGVYGRMSLCRMPSSAAVFSNSVGKSRLLPEKRLVNSEPQTMPEFNHAQGWISAAHVPDEFPFCFRMLVWMAVRPPGLTGKGCRTSIPALLPEVDVRPALVVFPTGAADAVFFCIPHERLPVVILLFMRDMVSFRQVVVW